MTLPEGLIYVPGFLTETEERDALAVLATFELHPYVLHDTPSRRLVRSFGPARTQWQRHIPAVTQERWSMTFRTLRRAGTSPR
jgi:hypothetical protein